MTDQPKPTKSRKFSLSTLAVDNGTSVILLTVMILLFGISAYNRIPKESFPEISFPTIYINTLYFGNSAADIENLVTRPLEKEIQNIDGLEELTSTSIPDYSVIVAEFETDIDIDDAVRKVKDAVDLAEPDLPDDLTEEPHVFDINLSEIPIMTINLSGNYSMDELRDYAEYLEDELESLNEVTSVEIKGALEREVRIDVDLPKMEAVEVNFQDIANTVQSENITMGGGEILTNDFRRDIRIIGEFQNMDDIRNLIVKSEEQNPVYLRDIAEVSYSFEDPTSISRMNMDPVVSLDVIKKSGENLLVTADKSREVLEKAKENYLPQNININIFNDQSIHTRDQVENLENSIISGVFLVTLVLLFFLGLRNATFVGLAIPLSMLIGILILYVSGISLNMVVLFSLILALGLLVDNAIVIVENIYRYMQYGYDGIVSAKYGAGEVAIAIIVSTATTLAAFLPLAFWPGIMGSFMQYLPLTLIIVLTSSLFVALVINPVLASRLMKIDDPEARLAKASRKRRNILIGAAIMLFAAIAMHFSGIEWARNILGLAILISLVNHFLFLPGANYFQNTVLPFLEKKYYKFISFALRGHKPLLFFGGTFVLLIFAVGLLVIRSPKVILFPEADPLYVNAFIEMPLGTDIEATNEMSREIEKRITEAIEPYEPIVDAVLTQVGENTSDPNSPPSPGSSPHKARITVSFAPAKDRDDLSTVEAMEDIREAVQGLPGVKITVDQNQEGPPTGKPINLEITGKEIDTLAIIAEDIIAYINQSGIRGIEELQPDVKLGKPQMIIYINREAARRFGISTYLIADAIRTAVYGKEVSQYKVGEDEYPIQVRLDKKYRYDVEDILNQKITFRDQTTGQISQVPISSVAEIEYSTTYDAIKRKDQDRVVTIFSNVLEGYNANEIVEELRGLMSEYSLPPGYSYEFTGEQEEQAENSVFLSTAFTVALFLIFIIIVAQFNSILAPFIIILSVLFSTIGVFLGYVATGMDVVIIMTGVGIISLAGVVVNNAIVLIDYIDLLLKTKRKDHGINDEDNIPFILVKEAIIEGGATRLRPVLLTAITTVLGLIPLAIGFNFNFFKLITDLDPQIFIGGDNVAFWGPMAWTVIYGLIFATFLTLVVVPVMYWLAFKLSVKMSSWIGISPQRSSIKTTGSVT